MRCPNPNFVWPNGKVIAVPCGKCLPCLSNKRHDWSARLMQEHRVSSSAHFVTLTYSDRFNPSCGVVKRHLQLYMKRLRKLTPRLRYYAVGEYGSKFGRPHYHAIIFNAEEKNIRSCWSLLDKKTGKSVPIGIVHLGKVNEASVSYTLKYVVQSREPVSGGLNPPFALMSRGYGLGLNYLTDEILKWHRDNHNVYFPVHGEKHRLARFYKDKIWPKVTEWYTRDGSVCRWNYMREDISKKSQKEAEQREEKEIASLKKKGYSRDDMEKFRNASYSRIKKKVSYSQKF